MDRNAIKVAIALGIGFLLGIVIGEVHAKYYYENDMEERVENEVEEQVHHLKQMYDKKKSEPVVELKTVDHSSEICSVEGYAIPNIHLITSEEFENDDTYEKVDLIWDSKEGKAYDIDGCSYCPNYTKIGGNFDLMSGFFKDKEVGYIRDELEATDYKIIPKEGESE